jgi:Fe-S protein assembly co-chaperone HscB
MDDYFGVFGLGRALQLDLPDLQRRFYELSRRHHPDFHQMKGDAERAAALERSALINRAYRVLRDPIARVEYLVALEEGREANDAAVKPKAPMDLLEEMLEIQEALEDAKRSGFSAADRARLGQERQKLIARRAADEAALIEGFAKWDRAIASGDDADALLRGFTQALATRAYLGTVIDDLGEALEEDDHARVSHHRN